MSAAPPETEAAPLADKELQDVAGAGPASTMLGVAKTVAGTMVTTVGFVTTHVVGQARTGHDLMKSGTDLITEGIHQLENPKGR